METTLRHQIFDTEDTFLLQDLLLTVRFALVVLFADMFAKRNGDIGIDTRCVDIFAHELIVFPEGFVPVYLDVIQREGHTGVGLCRVLVSSLDAERVFMRNDVLDKFNGRVAFAFVIAFAVLRGNDDILQTIDVRSHLDLDILAVLPFAQRQHLGFITQHLEVKGVVTGSIADGEITV